MLDRKKWAKKIIEFSSSSQENEIHLADSAFNEDFNKLFSRDALISREGRPENLGKMGNNSDIYCYANRRMVSFQREYQSLLSGTKILVIPRLSYMPDQILEKRCKNSILKPKFDLCLGSSPPKI